MSVVDFETRTTILRINRELFHLGWLWDSGEYIDSRSRLNLLCIKCNTPKKLAYKDILLKLHCSVCYKQSKTSNFFDTDVLPKLNQHKFKLLSSFKSAKDPLTIECSNKHSYNTTWDNLQQNGFKCSKCPKIGRKFIDDTVINSRVESLRYNLITIVEHGGFYSKIKIKCLKCDNIKIVSYESIIRNPGCKNCIKNELLEKGKLKIQEHIPKGYEVVDYKNPRTFCGFICNKGHNFKLHAAVVMRYVAGDYFCPYCETEKYKEAIQKKLIEEIRISGWFYVSGDYENKSSRFVIKCSQNHLKEIAYKARKSYIKPCFECCSEERRKRSEDNIKKNCP